MAVYEEQELKTKEKSSQDNWNCFSLVHLNIQPCLVILVLENTPIGRTIKTLK